MKRFMIATALTASMSTAAFAATPEEIATVEAYLPSIDASALSDEQVTDVVAVINSDAPRAEKLSQLNSVLTPGAQMSAEALPTDAQQAAILRVAPDATFNGVSQAQIDSAMAAINGGGSPSEISNQVQSILETNTNTSYAAMPTEAQRAEIERVAPGVDYSMLTQAQVDTALATINGGGSESEIAERVQTILGTDATPVGTANTASAAEIAILQRYLPDMEVETMTEAQLNTALSIVYGGGSESEIQSRLEGLANS